MLRVTAHALLSLFLSLTLTAVADESSDRTAINALLDDFHLAASEADRDRYLGHFSTNGVFMGTDDWERWPLEDFTTYVEGRFSNGGGWTYTSEERYIAFSGAGDTAWFDEIMVSEKWGRFRGTGVLVQQSGEWKLAHYSLTALVPNEEFEAVSKIATKGFEARKTEE